MPNWNLESSKLVPLLRSDLQACAIEIKDLKHQIAHSACYNVLSPPCDVCGSLKGKLFNATKKNTELKQEVAYLTSRLERTVVSEKLIEDDLGSFASVARELRRCTLTMLETYIMMSCLIFSLVLILMLCLTLLVLCLISLMDLTISHMVFVHDRTTLCLDTLVMADAHIVVIVSCMGPIFLLEGLTPTLSPDTLTVHIFPIVVLIPLVQRLRCKRP
jgi:hypothetical protein